MNRPYTICYLNLSAEGHIDGEFMKSPAAAKTTEVFRQRWLEMGADAVLVNTAIAVADDPVNMAKAFRLAVEAGLLARQSGPGSRSHFAHATSPLTGFLEASA